MREEKTSRIQIRTLGLLEIRLGEEELFSEKVPSGKLLQLFLILAWAGEKGIGRLKLQDYLYDRSTANAANGLRILMSRLRKLLARSRLPGDTYVVNKGYFYFLGGHLNIEMDAVQMEFLYKKALEEEQKNRICLLEQVCRLYEGEFLPSFSGEFWVESMRSHYQNIYFKSLRQLCSELSECGEYKRALAVVSEAVHIYPAMEEWTELQSGLFQQMREQFPNAYGNIEAISAGLLAGDNGDGAYFCAFPGFRDCVRMAVRDGDKQEKYLMSWVLVEKKSASYRNRKCLNEYMKQFCAVLSEELKTEDIYTMYGTNRALILTSDTRRRVKELKKAILSGFRKRCGADISVSVQSIEIRELRKKRKGR